MANFHDQKITWFNGAAGVDYVFEFNGETNDGTITYMEDEDRFDFDNAIKFVSAGDGTASWASSSLSGFVSITGTTLTDGTTVLTGGRITGVTDVIASDTVRASTFFDGTANWASSSLTGFTNVSASTLTSTVAIGTAPLTVTSTTVVNNLNADLLDGQHGTYYAPATAISGTTNYLAKFTSATTVGNSIIRDDGTYVSIGAAPGTYTLAVNGTGSFSGDIFVNDNHLIDAKLDSTYLSYNTWLQGRDATDAIVNMIRTYSSGYLEFGTIAAIGSLHTEADAGVTPIYEQAVSASTAGTEHAFTMSIDGVELIRGRGLSDGAGALEDGSEYVIIKGLYVTDNNYERAAVTTDTTFTSVVPAGYILKYVVLTETAGNTATLSMGTAASGTQLFTNQTVTASTITTFVINKVFSWTAATSLYLHDDAGGDSWNSGSVDVKIVMEKIDQ